MKTKTLRYRLGMAVSKAFLAMSVVMFIVGFGLDDAKTPGDVMDGRPDAVGSPVEIASHMKCGEGNTNGELPGHVIYHNGGDWKVGGTHMVGKALDQIFNEVDNGLTVYLFCK